MSTQKIPPADRVDRAVASVRAAVRRLGGLLDDEDPATVETVGAALAGIGPFAVGPLAAALARSPSPWNRA
jgi:hypothetical protein